MPNGGTIVFVQQVTVQVTVIDAETFDEITGVRVLLEADSGGPLSLGADILTGTTDGSGIISTSFDYISDQPVTGRARKGSSTIFYKTASIGGVITSDGYSLTVLMVPDE